VRARLISFILPLLIAATPVVAAEPAAAPSEMDGSIHRLGPDARQLRFEGETSTRVWAVYVTNTQAQSRARVHIAYSNAISVMPEASSIRIAVNDVEVATAPINAASDPGVIDVELPRGLLSVGYNALRVAVSQRHRVDCSLEATYELMTQLDPATSGLAFPGVVDAGVTTLDDLAAVSPDASGVVTLRAVVPDNASTHEIDYAIQAAEATAIRAHFVRPKVEVVTAIDEKPGLFVLAGLHSTLESQGFAAYLNTSGTPHLAAAARPGQRVVVVSGATDEDTEAALHDLAAVDGGDAPPATAPAIVALRAGKGFPIEGLTTVSFRDLGVRSEEFDGRLYRATFDLMLPPDFYPADYDKLTLSLSYGYSAGLARNAQILVRINEREAGSMPLGNPRGGVFENRLISVPLGKLRPGFNRLEIEAQTPTPQDAACEVEIQLAAHERFALFDKSELIVPQLARIAKMPNLAVTMSSGFPYTGTGDSAGRLLIGSRSPSEIGAAASFLARAAFVAGRPIAVRTTFDPSELGLGSALIAASFPEMRPDILSHFSLDPQALRRAWGRPGAIEAANASVTKTMKAKPGTKAEDAVANASLYDRWAEGMASTPSDFKPGAAVRSIYDRFINIHRDDLAWLRDPPRMIDVPDRSTMIIAQARAPFGGTGVWTLLVAANAEELSRDVVGITAPTNWDKVEGRASAFLPRSGVVIIPGAAEGFFIPTQSLRPGNLRLIAAGWLSSNIDYFFLAFLVGALLVGALTTWTVKVFGARP